MAAANVKQIDKSNPPTGTKVLIASVSGNKLFRVDNWHGDFWFELTDGETGFIDGMYELSDEADLIADFTRDYRLTILR